MNGNVVVYLHSHEHPNQGRMVPAQDWHLLEDHLRDTARERQRSTYAYEEEGRETAMTKEQGGLGRAGGGALEDTRLCSHCSTSRDDAPGRTRFMIDLCV